MQKQQQGFSLIELLIAMSLMVIITGFLIYMWINTVQTMRFAQSAVSAHTQGRRVIRLLTDTMQNTSGCYPLLAGDTGPSTTTFSAQLAGIDSYIVETIDGVPYARARGFKWSVAHRDESGSLLFDFDTQLPTFSSSPVHAYASAFATGRWVGGREVFQGQTVVPLNPHVYDMNRMYRSVSAGRLNARDRSNDAANTGNTEPDWPVTYGDTVRDGDVTWLCVPPYLHASPIHIPGSAVGRIAYDEVTGTGGIDTETLQSLAVDTTRRSSVFASNVSDMRVSDSSALQYEFQTEAERDAEFVDLHPLQYVGVQVYIIELAQRQQWVWDMGTDEGAWEVVFSGVSEPIDSADVYRGHRGTRPQGRGYRPHRTGDEEGWVHPHTPRWVRVDFEVTGDIRPGIEEAELPRFSFTHIMMLR